MKTNLSVLRCHFGGSFFSRKGTRLLCSDGKLRAPSFLAKQADTFFSIPAGIRLRGKYVRGYVTHEENESGQKAVVFRHLKAHEGELPAWPDKYTDAHDALVSLG